MTKSNNEWVPEIGIECKRLLSMGSFTVNDPPLFADGYYRGQTSFGEHIWENKNGTVQTLPSNASFIPLKTEAEKRRDEAVEDFKLRVFRCGGFYLGEMTEKMIAIKAIDTGYIKPKPLTNDVTLRLWKDSDNGSRLYEFAKAIEAYIRGEG